MDKNLKKMFFENIFMFLSLFAIVIARVAGKIQYPHFGLLNIMTLIIAFLGFVFLLYSKREQLTKKDFFRCGVSTSHSKDLLIYKTGYCLMATGLLLTFLI